MSAPYHPEPGYVVPDAPPLESSDPEPLTEDESLVEVPVVAGPLKEKGWTRHSPIIMDRAFSDESAVQSARTFAASWADLLAHPQDHYAEATLLRLLQRGVVIWRRMPPGHPCEAGGT